MKIIRNNLLCTLNHPGENRTAGLLKQIVGIVLDIRTALDLCTEGNYDESSPGTLINCTDLWQVIGIKHQRMGRNIGERIFVFLLCIDFIRGAELLYIGCVKSHTFLQFGGNEQSFTFCLGKFRLYISAASDRQHIGRDIATVGTKDSRHHIPEGRLAVSAFTVGNDKSLHIDLAHCGKTYDFLDIVNKGNIVLEEGVQSILPDIRSVISGGNSGLLGNEIFRVMITQTAGALAKVYRTGRTVQQKFIRIQKLLLNLKHRSCLF